MVSQLCLWGGVILILALGNVLAVLQISYDTKILDLVGGIVMIIGWFAMLLGK